MKPMFTKTYPFTSDQLPAHPFDLAADVVDDVAGFQVLRQYVPCVGLDLELARQRFLFVHLERLFERKACRPERTAQIVEEYRHVEVCAPFARTWVRFVRRERVFEIEDLSYLSVFLFHCLR
jgi:hypothetical protein